MKTAGLAGCSLAMVNANRWSEAFTGPRACFNYDSIIGEAAA
jgi:hypothetical protein